MCMAETEFVHHRTWPWATPSMEALPADGADKSDGTRARKEPRGGARGATRSAPRTFPGGRQGPRRSGPDVAGAPGWIWPLIPRGVADSGSHVLAMPRCCRRVSTCACTASINEAASSALNGAPSVLRPISSGVAPKMSRSTMTASVAADETPASDSSYDPTEVAATLLVGKPESQRLETTAQSLRSFR